MNFECGKEPQFECSVSHKKCKQKRNLKQHMLFCLSNFFMRLRLHPHKDVLIFCYTMLRLDTKFYLVMMLNIIELQFCDIKEKTHPYKNYGMVKFISVMMSKWK